jgi:hypothetical protein
VPSWMRMSVRPTARNQDWLGHGNLDTLEALVKEIGSLAAPPNAQDHPRPKAVG